MQNASHEKLSDAGTSVRGGDVLERLPTILKGIPDIDVSLIFGEMGKLCERVIFPNFVHYSGLLQSFSF